MKQLVDDFAEALFIIDQSGETFKNFQPGVGPYGEPQVTRKCLEILKQNYPDRYNGARTKRIPDILIPDQWAIEVKIVRPFGDNGCEAEHWSQNLLHPYEGNVSSMSDAIKLLQLDCSERKALLVFGYEHSPPEINLDILLDSFELISRQILKITLGPRVSTMIEGLVHPIHQRVRIIGWEVGG